MKGITLLLLLLLSYVVSGQTDSSRIVNLPFNSYLKAAQDTDTMIIEKSGDSLVMFYEQIEKIDSTKRWKLIGLKIIESASGGPFSDWTPLNTDPIFIAKEPREIIVPDSIINSFGLNNKSAFLKRASLYGAYGESYDWTPFLLGKTLVIKKCVGSIGSIVSSETIYEYYFEEVD